MKTLLCLPRFVETGHDQSLWTRTSWPQKWNFFFLFREGGGIILMRRDRAGCKKHNPSGTVLVNKWGGGAAHVESFTNKILWCIREAAVRWYCITTVRISNYVLSIQRILLGSMRYLLLQMYFGGRFLQKLCLAAVFSHRDHRVPSRPWLDRDSEHVWMCCAWQRWLLQCLKIQELTLVSFLSPSFRPLKPGCSRFVCFFLPRSGFRHIRTDWVDRQEIDIYIPCMVLLTRCISSD